jgi:hypothetical protein
MGRRSGEKLVRRDMVLYDGDWERLQLLLATTRVSPTEFIRRLVRKTILRIESARAGLEQPVEDIDVRTIDAIESTSDSRSE